MTVNPIAIVLIFLAWLFDREIVASFKDMKQQAKDPRISHTVYPDERLSFTDWAKYIHSQLKPKR